MSQSVDLAGLDLYVNSLSLGNATPGSTSGTNINSTELNVLDSVTPGTAAASKAVVLNSSKGISTITSATITTLTATAVNSGTLTATGQITSSTVTALGTTGTVSLDPTLGMVFTCTPTGGITLNAASAPAGARVYIVVTTSGSSSFNVTPTTNFKTTGALATGTASGKVFTLTFVGDGTNMNEVSRTVAM